MQNWFEGLILAFSMAANHQAFQPEQSTLFKNQDYPRKHELYVMAKIDQNQHYGVQYRYAITPQVQLRLGMPDVQIGEMMTGVRVSGSIFATSILKLGQERGSLSGFELNGHLKKFKYYPLRAADTQLQLLTQ